MNKPPQQTETHYSHGRKRVAPAMILITTVLLMCSQQVFADNPGVQIIKRALLVGVSQENTMIGLPMLPAIDRDLSRMKRVLEKQGYQTLTLLNPNKAQLLEKFEELAVFSAVDEFVFFYSGHSADNVENGYLVPVLSDQASMATKTAAENGDDPFAAAELKAELISSEELHNLLKLSLASRQLVFIDGNTHQMCKPRMFAEHILSMHFYCAGPGAVAKPDGGVFTSLIVNGLKGKADKDGDGKVDALELETWLKRRVPEVLVKKSTLMRNPGFFHFGENQVLSVLLSSPASSGN